MWMVARKTRQSRRPVTLNVYNDSGDEVGKMTIGRTQHISYHQKLTKLQCKDRGFNYVRKCDRTNPDEQFSLQDLQKYQGE